MTPHRRLPATPRPAMHRQCMIHCCLQPDHNTSLHTTSTAWGELSKQCSWVSRLATQHNLLRLHNTTLPKPRAVSSYASSFTVCELSTTQGVATSTQSVHQTHTDAAAASCRCLQRIPNPAMDTKHPGGLHEHLNHVHALCRNTPHRWCASHAAEGDLTPTAIDQQPQDRC